MSTLDLPGFTNWEMGLGGSMRNKKGVAQGLPVQMSAPIRKIRKLKRDDRVRGPEDMEGERSLSF